jgi:hypothetical protein
VYYRVGKMTKEWDSLEDDAMLHICQKGSHAKVDTDVGTQSGAGGLMEVQHVHLMVMQAQPLGPPLRGRVHLTTRFPVG